jgi:hypothetical protein
VLGIQQGQPSNQLLNQTNPLLQQQQQQLLQQQLLQQAKQQQQVQQQVQAYYGVKHLTSLIT